MEYADPHFSETVSCPYCGEHAEIFIDVGGGNSQSYVEDCPVCCRPWDVNVQVTDNLVSVAVRSLDQ